jgi:hypothetical protein
MSQPLRRIVKQTVSKDEAFSSALWNLLRDAA